MMEANCGLIIVTQSIMTACMAGAIEKLHETFVDGAWCAWRCLNMGAMLACFSGTGAATLETDGPSVKHAATNRVLHIGHHIVMAFSERMLSISAKVVIARTCTVASHTWLVGVVL
jgi:uncharacterized membrane protein (DUF441 family)